MTKSIVTRIILLTLFLKVDNVLTPKFIYFTLGKKKKRNIQLTLTVTYGVFLNLGIRIQISKRQKLTIAPEVEHKLKSVNCSVHQASLMIYMLLKPKHTSCIFIYHSRLNPAFELCLRKHRYLEKILSLKYYSILLNT